MGKRSRQQRRKQVREAKEKVVKSLSKLPPEDREPVIREVGEMLDAADRAKLSPEKQKELGRLEAKYMEDTGIIRGKQFAIAEKKKLIEEDRAELRRELARLDVDDVEVDQELRNILARRVSPELDETFNALPAHEEAMGAADDVYELWFNAHQGVTAKDNVAINRLVADLSKVFYPFMEVHKDHPRVVALWEKFNAQPGWQKQKKEDWLRAIGQLYANKYITDRATVQKSRTVSIVDVFWKVRDNGAPVPIVEFYRKAKATKGFEHVEKNVEGIFFDTRIDWEKDPLDEEVLCKLLKEVTDAYYKFILIEAERDKSIRKQLFEALDRFAQTQQGKTGADLKDMAAAVARYMACIRVNRVRDIELMTEEERKKSLTKEEMVRSVQNAKEKFHEAHPFAWSTTKVQLWTDEALTETGVKMWEQTYRQGFSDTEMLHHAGNAARAWGDAAKRNGVPMSEARMGVAESMISFSAKWAVHAFQRITTSHTYAAALMCSDADKAVLGDIELQWHAFMVCVPNGLLQYHDDELGISTEYNRVLVASYEAFSVIILLNQLPGRIKNRIVVHVATTLADLLDVSSSSLEPMLQHSTDPDPPAGSTTRAQMGRISTMAKRLVAGLLLAMQNQNNFKSKTVPYRKARSSREQDEPAHRVVMMGIPLKIDCRPEVAKYIKSGPTKKGGMPSVQTLVRGHYKRQVVGVGRTGRKVVWIEPYWKGKEDAPILTRPKRVGG